MDGHGTGQDTIQEVSMATPGHAEYGLDEQKGVTCFLNGNSSRNPNFAIKTHGNVYFYMLTFQTLGENPMKVPLEGFTFFCNVWDDSDFVLSHDIQNLVHFISSLRLSSHNYHCFNNPFGKIYSHSFSTLYCFPLSIEIGGLAWVSSFGIFKGKFWQCESSHLVWV